MKLEKISKLALYSCIGLGVVCFALFFLVDYNNMDFDGVHVSPALTNVILILMYLLLAVTAGLTVWSLIRGVLVNSGNTGPSPTGIAGGRVSLITWSIVIVALIIGVVLGLGEEPYTTNSGVTTSGGMVTVVDMWICAIYILSIVAIAAVVVSMTGYLSKSATPKA